MVSSDGDSVKDYWVIISPDGQKFFLRRAQALRNLVTGKIKMLCALGLFGVIGGMWISGVSLRQMIVPAIASVVLGYAGVHYNDQQITNMADLERRATAEEYKYAGVVL